MRSVGLGRGVSPHSRGVCGAQEGPKRMALQRRLLQMQMQLLLATWSARIRYHGPRPVPAANRVIDSHPPSTHWQGP